MSGMMPGTFFNDAGQPCVFPSSFGDNSFDEVSQSLYMMSQRIERLETFTESLVVKQRGEAISQMIDHVAGSQDE